MSLLRDIQNAAIDANVDVSVVLRKCKVLAARLGNPNLATWVEDELNGYTDVESLPEYRIIQVHSKGHFAGYAGRRLQNADIPISCIPKKYREQMRSSYMMQPISAYVSLLERSDGDNLQEPWSPDFTAMYGRDIYQNMNCMQAWKVIPRAAVVSLVEAVRNRILSFVLEIESENPKAGEAEINKPPISQERVTQIFNTTINGSVGNLTGGSSHFSQSLQIVVTPGDLESLQRYLTSLGLSTDEVQELETAVKADGTHSKQKELGKSVTGWLGVLMTKIAKGVVPTLKGIEANLITKALLMYYGIE